MIVYGLVKLYFKLRSSKRLSYIFEKQHCLTESTPWIILYYITRCVIHSWIAFGLLCTVFYPRIVAWFDVGYILSLHQYKNASSWSPYIPIFLYWLLVLYGDGWISVMQNKQFITFQSQCNTCTDMWHKWWPGSSSSHGNVFHTCILLYLYNNSHVFG